MEINNKWIALSLFYIPYFCSATNYILKDDKVPCHPCHVHISYGKTISDITVMWATMEHCNSTLSYGTDPWSYQHTVIPEDTHFDKPTESGLQCVYRAQLQNLAPNTTYFYRPTSGDISSGPHFFKTPVETPPTEFLICGDHSIESESLPYVETEIMSGQYDAVLHVGEFTDDMIEEDQQDKNETGICYPRTGDMGMNIMTKIASRVPYLSTPGSQVKGDLFSHYRHWFSMPGVLWPMPLDKMWYSINIGPVHFVSYSTEVFFLESPIYASQQQSWLMADLININRSEQPWIIAFGHKPMYCSFDNEDDCTKTDSKVRKGLEDVLFTYGVDVIIQAHGPSYERLFPLFHGEALNKDYNNPKAPVQIITGTSKILGEEDGATGKKTYPNWSARRLDKKGLNSFSRLKVYNKTHLSWEQVSSKTKEILDSVWVTQEKHGPFIVPPSHITKAPQKPSVNVENSNAEIPNKAANVDGNSNNNGQDSTTTSSVQEFFDIRSNQIMFGVGIGVITLVLLISIIITVKRKQRIKSYRRWDATVDYGRKFYSAYSQVGKDDKDGSDFEVDSSEGNPSSKLLSEKPS